MGLWVYACDVLSGCVRPYGDSCLRCFGVGCLLVVFFVGFWWGVLCVCWCALLLYNSLIVCFFVLVSGEGLVGGVFVVLIFTVWLNVV